jgi:hypothetical protein
VVRRVRASVCVCVVNDVMASTAWGADGEERSIVLQRESKVW